MESLYGAGTDPVPYILLAYGVGAVALVGFALWCIVERRRIRRLMLVMRDGSP